MLIRFEVSNFRSILDSIELSMVAVDRDRPAAREAARLGESLLTVAGIYGPNASGKSNVLAALRWLADAVRSSVHFWDKSIAVVPFAFGEGPHQSSHFTIEMLISDVRYEYAVELDRHKIHYEGLFHYPEKKRRRIFERDGLNLALQRGLGDLAGTRQLLTDQTLALSAAHRFGEPLVSDFVDTLLDMNTRGVPKIFPSAKETNWLTDSWFDQLWLERECQQEDRHPTKADQADFERKRKEALALLRLADLGIEDVAFEVDEAIPPGDIVPQLVHRSSTGARTLDFSAESAGTQNWYHLIGLLLGTLQSGSVLILDEIDASLHPTLSAQLLQLFHDPATNLRGAQLIFTTHDTSLLNYLNRDEVWFTDKQADGSTRLGALAEFSGERVRKSRNLENAYLHGRFGALPDVDRAELLRALGLIA